MLPVRNIRAGAAPGRDSGGTRVIRLDSANRHHSVRALPECIRDQELQLPHLRRQQQTGCTCDVNY